MKQSPRQTSRNFTANRSGDVAFSVLISTYRPTEGIPNGLLVRALVQAGRWTLARMRLSRLGIDQTTETLLLLRTQLLRRSVIRGHAEVTFQIYRGRAMLLPLHRTPSTFPSIKVEFEHRAVRN